MEKRKYDEMECTTRKRIKFELHSSLSKCEENIESGFYILNIKTKNNTNFYVLEKLIAPFHYNLNLFEKTWMSTKYNIESVSEYRVQACEYNSTQFEDPVATWIFYLPYGFVNNNDEIGYVPEKDFKTLNVVELKLKYPKSYFSFY